MGKNDHEPVWVGESNGPKTNGFTFGLYYNQSMKRENIPKSVTFIWALKSVPALTQGDRSCPQRN